MIIVLLILIVLILLFGAAAVRGWIRTAGTLILGFLLIVGAALSLISILGEEGAVYVFFGGAFVLLGIGLWLKATEPEVDTDRLLKPKPKPKPTFHSRVPSKDERKRLRELHRQGPREG